MVRTFCDRCGRVITGMSAHERVSVTASGAGGGEIDAAIAAGADVFLTGEIKHHEALYAMHRGICVVESGHFETERPVLESLCEALQKACDAVQYNISVFCSRVNPF